MKALMKALVVWMYLTACLRAAAGNPVACSTFDEKGEAATAVLAGERLRIQITQAGGGPSSTLETSIDGNGATVCSVFFDSEDRYVAVGISHLGIETGPLHIAAADLTANKPMSSFTVQPDVGLGTSLNLAGFWNGGPNLVVFGTERRDHPTKAFTSTQFRVNGEQVSHPEIHQLPEDAGPVGNVHFVDAAHNRLWFKSKPMFCPLRSVSLSGNSPPGPVVDDAGAKAVCDVVDAIAFPNENALITPVSRDTGDLVARVDLLDHTVDQILLPSGQRTYSTMGRAMPSADGQVLAVTRDLLAHSPFVGERTLGTELDIMQVAPLKVIGKVRLKPDVDLASLSIDHRKGVVTVLSFSSKTGTWKSQAMAP